MSAEIDPPDLETGVTTFDNLFTALIGVISHLHNYLLTYVERFQALSLHGQILTLLLTWLVTNILLINLAWRIYGTRICDPTTTGTRLYMIALLRFFSYI